MCLTQQEENLQQLMKKNALSHLAFILNDLLGLHNWKQASR